MQNQRTQLRRVLRGRSVRIRAESRPLKVICGAANPGCSRLVDSLSSTLFFNAARFTLNGKEIRLRGPLGATDLFNPALPVAELSAGSWHDRPSPCGLFPRAFGPRNCMQARCLWWDTL